jgi:hypothetical protein
MADPREPDDVAAPEPMDHGPNFARALERGTAAPGVGMVEKMKEEEADPPEDASLLLQVASGFVFSLFVVLIGLMAVAVIRHKPIGDAIPAGGAKFVIGIGLILLALLVAATRVRNKAANNLLVGMILGVAAVGLAVVALRGLLTGILEGK